MSTAQFTTVIKTEPTVEPVSLQDIKEHLLLDSGAFDDNLTFTQSIVPGAHVIAAAYTLVGASSDVLGYSAEVVLDSGVNGATGTVDVKIQESDDDIAFTDWTGGAFVQVTTANDNAIQKKAYTGSKQYVRAVATVLLATCDFGVQVINYASDTTQDSLLSTLITAARQQVEATTQRALITQTWYGYLDHFPSASFFELPFGQLQSVDDFDYTDSDGTVTEMTVTTDYLVDSDSDPGRVVLPYGVSWPSFTAYPVNPIAVEYVCGYGDTASTVPASLRTAIKMKVEDLFNHRDGVFEILNSGSVIENKAVDALIWPSRLWTEM